MKRVPRYLIPACVAAFLFGSLYLFRDVREKAAPKLRGERSDFVELEEWPHGRVFTLVVDEKAVFVGDDPIAFEAFEAFLRGEGRKLKPDFVVLFGTDLARYGKVVEVYAAIRTILAVPEQIITRPVPLGTRFQAIKVCEHYWDYDSEEEEEPNQSLEPTTLLGTSAAEQPLVPSRVVAHL